MRWRPAVPEMGLDQPWAIGESAAQLIQGHLLSWIQNPREGHEFIARQMEAASRLNADPFAEGPGYELVGRVAVVRFEGVVCKRLSFWGFLFGGSASTTVLKESLANAIADPAVASVLLLVDSPGGTTRGVQEAADAVYAARTKKAIWTLGEDCMASSAYWIGSQATKVYASVPDALMGGVGVMTTFTDVSQMLAAAGIKVEVIASSALKGVGVRGTSLTPEARAYLQEDVDGVRVKMARTSFVRGRGLADEMAMTLSDGRCHQADKALALGLIDGIATLDALVGPLEAELAVVPSPEVIGPTGPPYEDEEEPEEAKAKASPNSTREEAVAPVAQKENEMSDQTKEGAGSQQSVGDGLAALEQKLRAEFTGQLSELKAENATLKTQLAGTSGTVTEIKSDRDLERLLTEARGEVGGPVKLAGDVTDQKSAAFAMEKVIRETWAVSPDAARKVVENLPVIGKGSGSVTGGTAKLPGGATAPPSATTAFKFDPYHGTSTNPAYQAMVQWGIEQTAAGVVFKNATDWIAKYDAAHPRQAVA